MSRIHATSTRAVSRTRHLLLRYALQEDHREEDTHSILNTLAIKRYRPDARVIVEVLQHESKHWLQLYRLPSVDVICVEELRNGLLAHSCLHPGLTTMMINFVRTVTKLAEDADYKERAAREAWLHDYS